MSEIKPIRPDEVKPKKPVIPDFVVEAFNELIKDKWNERIGRAIVKQEEAVQKILEKVPQNEENPFKRSDIFKNHYLDVEDLYRECGWVVKYTKRKYYEKEDHFFTFSEKEEED